MISILLIGGLVLASSHRVQGQSNIYNSTNCIPNSDLVSWTAWNFYYQNSTLSKPFTGQNAARILYGIITNNQVPFDVRCPGASIVDPYSAEQIMDVPCTTDFRGYDFPPKSAVGEVWMDTSFDERNFSIRLTQTWWCQRDRVSGVYNITATGYGVLNFQCNADSTGRSCYSHQANISGKVIAKQDKKTLGH